MRILKTLERTQTDFSIRFNRYDIGYSSLIKNGDALPEASLNGIKSSDAAMVGMISGELDAVANPIGKMRRELMLYADVRPAKPFPGLWAFSSDLDIVCIRESTEGFMSDRNLYKGYGEMMPTKDLVVSHRIVTRDACRRIAKFAFEFARRHGRKKITVAHKASVFRMGCGLMLECVREIGQDYPDILVEDEYVDLAAHNLIAHPEKYDVLLTSNLFGDILSDVATALVSDMVPSANIGDDCAVFIPVNHVVKGSDDRYETANPLPLLKCAAMMLGHLGLHDASGKLEAAMAAAVGNLGFSPYKMDGEPTASRIADEICAWLTK